MEWVNVNGFGLCDRVGHGKPDPFGGQNLIPPLIPVVAYISLRNISWPLHTTRSLSVNPSLGFPNLKVAFLHKGEGRSAKEKCSWKIEFTIRPKKKLRITTED